MSQAPRSRAVAAWPIEKRDWYLNLVAQADDSFGTVDDVSTCLERYNSLSFDRCIFLAGNGQRRVVDINGALWSDDRRGRWNLSRSKPLEWLHQHIARLARLDNHPVGKGEVASHICGFCNCIRAEHIKFQSKSEDILDMRHHEAVGAGSIRSEHVPKSLSMESPVSVMV